MRARLGSPLLFHQIPHTLSLSLLSLFPPPLKFAAIVNINLAVVNLLPLPALDGGYLALIALEAARGGAKLPEGVEQGIMTSGFLLLLATGVVLVVRDTLTMTGLGG